MNATTPTIHRFPCPALLLAATLLAGCSVNHPTVTWDGRPVGSGASPAALSGPDSITAVPVKQRAWNFGSHEGMVLLTPHYRIYTTLTRHSVLDRLPLFMERALAQYTSALAHLPEPTTKLDTYLFETRGQWEAKTRQMLPDQAATFLTLGRGGFTTHGTSVLYYIGRSDTLAIAAHEGWHQYSQRTFRSPLPLWLEEGIATWMEGYVTHPDGLPRFRAWSNLERYHTLRDAVRAGQLIPLGEIMSRTPQSFLESGKNRLLIYYAQVWALTHFLCEGENARYRSALQLVLTEAAQGRLKGTGRRGSRAGTAVLVDYFDDNPADFERRYRAFVDEIVQTGGRSRIVQGRSPLD